MKKALKFTALAALVFAAVITLSSGISKRDSGYRDLVEELYEQAAKQNNELEAIEEDIDKFEKKKQEAVSKYETYHSYHSRYYQDARSNLATISDPAINKRASDIITASEARYKTKIADWQTTIAALNAGEKELRGLHALLKIMISEAMIDKSQNSGLPDSGKAKEVNGDIQQVIQRIKAITK